MGQAVRKKFNNLVTLVLMQLKDKIDMSFVRSVKKTVIRAVLTVLKIAVIAAVFYAFFYFCKITFFPTEYIPDAFVSVLFTAIQVMAIITCTIGLTQTLYTAADNKVLLTLPVTTTEVYISKLILYFLLELKRNLTLTLPVLLAYGIINGAIWYFYPWLLICFVFISLVPVAIGALLSCPTLYIWQFVKRLKWLQATLILLGVILITAALVWATTLIPTNVELDTQLKYFKQWLQHDFLSTFVKVCAPYYYLTRMMLGGTLRITSYKLIQGDTFLYFGVMLVSVAALLALSFAIARPMFVKMVSREFEYDKHNVKPQKNRVHHRRFSSFCESMKMELRSGSFITFSFIQLALPAIAILFLNALFAAMNLSYRGVVMTKTFNLLVLLVMTLAFNNVYASVYSKEAAARNILKTRPQKPIYTLLGRIVFRAGVIFLSTLAAVVVFLQSSTAESGEILLMGLITLFVSESHLMWCAEMDIMHNYADQYQTTGVRFDSPNENKATIIGFVLAALFTLAFYFLTDRGTMSALVKCLCIALVFTAVRTYLFIIRAKLYFLEN